MAHLRRGDGVTVVTDSKGRIVTNVGGKGATAPTAGPDAASVPDDGTGDGAPAAPVGEALAAVVSAANRWEALQSATRNRDTALADLVTVVNGNHPYGPGRHVDASRLEHLLTETESIRTHGRHRLDHNAYRAVEISHDRYLDAERAARRTRADYDAVKARRFDDAARDCAEDMLKTCRETQVDVANRITQLTGEHGNHADVVAAAKQAARHMDTPETTRAALTGLITEWGNAARRERTLTALLDG